MSRQTLCVLQSDKIQRRCRAMYVEFSRASHSYSSGFANVQYLITQQTWQWALDWGSEPGFVRRRRGWSCATPCTGYRCWRSPCWPSRTAARRQGALLDGRRWCGPPRSPGDPPGCTSRCPPCGCPLHLPWTASSPPFLWRVEEGANKAPRRWRQLQKGGRDGHTVTLCEP